MEAAGLAIGIAALAGLCSNCVDAFSLISETKEFSIDYEVLSIRLDVEKTRLLQWAEGVGLLAEDSKDRHAELLSPRTCPQLERILLAVKLLLTKSEDLASVYGLARDKSCWEIVAHREKLSISSRRTQNFRAAFTQSQGQMLSTQKRVKLSTKAKWVINDHEKFEKLISHVHELISSLYDFVIIPRTFRRLMIKEDIESLGNDLHELRLLQRASEDQSAEWSECTNLQIEASQQATNDFRTIEEWLEDVTNMKPFRDALIRERQVSSSNVWQEGERELVDEDCRSVALPNEALHISMAGKIPEGVSRVNPYRLPLSKFGVFLKVQEFGKQPEASENRLPQVPKVEGNARWSS